MSQFFYLTPMLGGPGAPRYPVLKTPQLVGRSDRVDIPLFEPTVSRQHAIIQQKEKEIVLKDLGSKHGTFVNSRRISEAKLKIGDIVVFGLSLVLRLEASEKPVLPPEPLTIASSQQSEFIVEPQEDPSITAIRSMATPRVSSRRPARPTQAFSDESAALPENAVQLIKLYKQAAIGAYCIIQLPALLLQAEQLTQGSALQTLTADRGAPREPLAAQAKSLQEKIAELTKSVAILSPPPAENVVLVDVVKQAIALVKPLITRRQMELLAEVDPSLRVWINPPRIISALAEILRLACNFSPEESLVEIVALSSPKGVLLTISDQGKGFPQEIVDRLHDPLTTIGSDLELLRSHLSLFQAYHSILSCGGKTTITSKPNIGTTVRIHLPTPS